MKQSPQFTKIQEQMKPGVITLDGFLGTDTRNLIDILVEDDGTVRRLGLTHAQIADRMEYFRQKGLDGLGEFIHIDSSFDVRVDSVRGGASLTVRWAWDVSESEYDRPKSPYRKRGHLHGHAYPLRT